MPSVTSHVNFAQALQKADEGDVEAMFTAVSYMAAEGYAGKDAEPEINERYMSYLEKLVQAGSTSALIMLGTAFVNGDVTSPNPEEAIRLFSLAAANGESFGNECIGMMYYEGDVVTRDFQKAFEYFTKDESEKSFCTYYALGEMYRLGLYVEKNAETACEYYSKIACSKSKSREIDDYFWRAQYRLACAKHHGNGTAKDLEEALKLIEGARKSGRTEKEMIPGEGITKEAINQEWFKINRDLGKI